MTSLLRHSDALSWITAMFGLYWFAASFFLAKRSLPNISRCDEAEELLRETLGLEGHVLEGVLPSPASSPRQGCWLERQVDAMFIVVVDALRFDFALYNLPRSIGSRLDLNEVREGRQLPRARRTHLLQFVADPPTVTMQRLKALTTGGLPTFADISANFGGATVEEDSWIEMLRNMPWEKRGLADQAQVGFVGDDTWVDLYPNSFSEAYPYPSFNTRDLDTVDNGCLEHIPAMSSRMRTAESDGLEVMIVHFLGVDHVGHTYGPHNEHMDAKLRQMDAALSDILDKIDSSDSCQVALIFGDHGMTEDGNHGGGTEEEVTAALFSHSSSACTTLSLGISYPDSAASAAFESIHQIDLVPTIAVLLGLPIPFANLGSAVPSLLPGIDARQTAVALALNSAQVWRYFELYARTANRLPGLTDLHNRLMVATDTFQRALSNTEVPDSDMFIHAAVLFKLFLQEALELGQRVWTRFDWIGMIAGIIILFVGLLWYSLPLLVRCFEFRFHFVEDGLAVSFIAFQSLLLTFSNSYILEEHRIVMFCMVILSLGVALRIRANPVEATIWRGLILLPLASRLNDLLVSGHGLDPSIPAHSAHHPAIFLSSLALLGFFRCYLFHRRVTSSLFHTLIDCSTIYCLAGSWWEKRHPEHDRDGFFLCRVALILLFSGIPLSVFQAILASFHNTKRSSSARLLEDNAITVLSKFLLAIVTVTGPSTATSLVLYIVQVLVLHTLSGYAAHRFFHVSSFVLATLCRLVTRHIFFSTNHGCAFNRLQYSAAFVATTDFYFVTGGISLFLNTFGWEVAGIAFAWLFSQHKGRSSLWKIYGTFQMLEALASCISVSLLRRHLMVWDVYAPHFLFTSIFTVLNGLSQLSSFALSSQG